MLKFGICVNRGIGLTNDAHQSSKTRDFPFTELLRCTVRHKGFINWKLESLERAHLVRVKNDSLALFFLLGNIIIPLGVGPLKITAGMLFIIQLLSQLGQK